ncbi:DUF4233 domain-containing protein [Nocardioides pantholopis]|uniref:DUF4233 domain-containing protein n=1 Tax=Nocardioides pantholopis TaxID=2483798 RepID=UPI001F495E21|nr:DUF4233 domain-containing protein [Nocardioides pantholopis]
MSAPTPQDPAPEEPTPEERERTKSPRRGMCAAVLALEAITLGLTTPVLITVADVDLPVALGIGLGLTLACLLLAGMLRAEWAYGVGWLIQVAAIALGLVIPMMFFLGGIFALLWGTAYFLGKRIERERAQAWAAYDAQRSSS